jgi:hypothetical protein
VFSEVVATLLSTGLQFDELAFEVTTDERGVAMGVNEALTSSKPIGELLSLRHGGCVQMICRDESMSLTCTFGSPHERQIFSLAVSRRLWLGLADKVLQRYEALFALLATASGLQAY